MIRSIWNDPADEHYKNEKIWPNLVILAQAYGLDTRKIYVCIWLNFHGKRPVFATTLSHNNATMRTDVFLDLVTADCRGPATSYASASVQHR